MAGKYVEIRQALGAAITLVQPDMNVFHYTPRSFTPPVAIVQPEMRRTIDYEKVYSSGFVDWYFNILIVVGLIDEEASQEKAGGLISPESQLIAALHGALPYVQVLEASISEQSFKTSAVYTYARISLLIKA
jgi:hypothetical protein